MAFDGARWCSVLVLGVVLAYGPPARADDPPAAGAPTEEHAEEGATTVEAPPASPAPRATTEVYVTGGAAIVAALVGLGLGVSALSAESDFKSAPSVHLLDRGTQTAFAADVCFGVALTLAVTSVTLFFKKPSSKKRHTPTTVGVRF